MNKITKDVASIAYNTTFKVFEDHIIPRYIELMNDEYNRSINVYSNLFHATSHLIPNRFQSLFIDRLTSFEYNNKEAGQIVFPDLEDFIFGQELEPLQYIMEGLAPGNYLEIDERERRLLNNFRKSPISFRLDGTEIYLYDTKKQIYKSLEGLIKERNIILREYPLSRSGPIDIFRIVRGIMKDEKRGYLSTIRQNITRNIKHRYN